MCECAERGMGRLMPFIGGRFAGHILTYTIGEAFDRVVEGLDDVLCATCAEFARRVDALSQEWDAHVTESLANEYDSVGARHIPGRDDVPGGDD